MVRHAAPHDAVVGHGAGEPPSYDEELGDDAGKSTAEEGGHTLTQRVQVPNV